LLIKWECADLCGALVAGAAMIRLVFAAMVGLIAVLVAATREPGVPIPAAAPAAADANTFDNGTIDPDGGFASQSTHDDDRVVFDKTDLITPDGLGPTYNAQSCRECHQNPISGAASQFLEQRAGHLDRRGFFVDPDVHLPGGDTIRMRNLINDRAICPQAQERVPEGEPIRTSRLSLNLLGDGLVEAVADKTILALRRKQCATTAGVGTGICGVAIWVPVLEAISGNEEKRLGRFGWKNQHASLLSFAADAYLNEMGVTNCLQKDEFTKTCNPPVTADPNGADGAVTEPNDLPSFDGGSHVTCETAADAGSDGGTVEKPLADIDKFARFVRATKPPQPDQAFAGTPKVQRGRKRFNDIGCAICHTPTLATMGTGELINGGAFAVPAALGGKIFSPFSDFLLHDVGTKDNVAISGAEHFTPARYREQIRKDRAKRAARGKQDLEDWMCEEGLEDCRADLRTTQRPKGIPFYKSKACDPRRLAKSEVSAATSDLFIDVQCTANKLRTPPLWGVRLRTRLMHDGQSVVMEDAILRHQGEAKRVTDKFKGLSPQDKAAVVAFLLSL